MSLADVIGPIPYRAALAGGWIDQPFISRLNPEPSGSMVVVSLEPDCRFMDRSGFATGTRLVAQKRWPAGLPDRDPAALTRELYEAENAGRPEPSGSQDMVGLIYPGISRLDYDVRVHGGVFPAHLETVQTPEILHWFERVFHVLPVAPRPAGYNPLGEQNLDPDWVRRLGRSGRDCFAAICRRDLPALGASMNLCMECWEALLPHTVRHPALTVDLKALLRGYQERYPGAMYSGCGGGYLFVVSEHPVPGALRVRTRGGPHPA